MKAIFCLFTVLFLNSVANAQAFSVSGIVIDAVTKQPLRGASVFCPNTTFGTTTNAAGEYLLTLPNGGYDLTISFTGYESQSKRISQSAENLLHQNTELNEKQKSLEEVSITVTTEVKDGLAKYGSFFRDLFIGQSINSNKCTIQNPEVLHFFFSKKKNKLKVVAQENIIIQNKALGYTINYQLDSFTHEYGSGITQFTGFPLFEEMKGTDEEKQVWKDNREKAYFGSLLHFMHAYYDSTLAASGFKVELINKTTSKTKLLNNPYDSSFVTFDNEEMEWHFPSSLRIVYQDEIPEAGYLLKNKMPTTTKIQISQLDFLDNIIVQQNGYFYDQRDLIVQGYFEWEKIADFLPYNYNPED
jgi:CarboxypepD_reg-like domain